MKVAFFPNDWRGNPYLRLLENSLNDCDVAVINQVPRSPYLSWLWRNRGVIHVLHVHWPESVYSWEASRWNAIVAAGKFIFQLLIARWLGYRVVWTMHNLYPHERNYPTIDYLVWQGMARLSHRVVVHCEAAKMVFNASLYRRKKVDVIPIGSYEGVHGPIVSKKEAHRILSVPQDIRVFLFLGELKPYKGLEALIGTFTKLDLPDSVLVIAGRAASSSYQRSLEACIRGHSNVRLEARWLTDLEIGFWLGAADVVVLPFTKTLTTSSVILAMSYGRPVIAPKKGCIPELVDSKVGVLYAPSRADGISTALRAVMSMDLARMGAEALGRARSWQWADVAQRFNQVYHS